MEHLPLVTVGLARVRPSVISGDAEDGQAAIVDLERHNVKLSGGMVEAILAWGGQVRPGCSHFLFAAETKASDETFNRFITEGSFVGFLNAERRNPQTASKANPSLTAESLRR